MTDSKRTIWDDMVELGREIIERIDETLNPNRKQPVPVPIPVRNNPRHKH